MFLSQQWEVNGEIDRELHESTRWIEGSRISLSLPTLIPSPPPFGALYVFVLLLIFTVLTRTVPRSPSLSYHVDPSDPRSIAAEIDNSAVIYLVRVTGLTSTNINT